MNGLPGAELVEPDLALRAEHGDDHDLHGLAVAIAIVATDAIRTLRNVGSHALNKSAAAAAVRLNAGIRVTIRGRLR